jgi:ABC-type bacteriocin/lantibiotic exporter with double-glycine peptidase domain
VNKAGQKIQVYKRLELKILENTFSGIKEIKFNSKEFFFSKLFNDNYFKANRVIFLQDLINKLPKISLEMLAIISITGISVFFYNSELSTVAKISNLSFLTVVAIRLIPAFTGISVATISIKYVEPSIDIIVRDMKSSSYYSNLDNMKIESYTKKIKEIKLENLTFNYGLKNERLLENINLSIVENDKIGIHGTSGSGKTTLINLLTGLIPPTKGNVYFNEINIHNKTNIFYNKISYITQDTFLFDDTIENNIIFYGNNIDNNKLNKIVKICQLKNFIDNNPLGLQQNIGEKGLRISGGQKQRIGIARALYKDFDILILDEATSALNKDYERSIIRSLHENFKDKIIIIISHDKENLLNCNKIINIENNQINIKDN